MCEGVIICLVQGTVRYVQIDHLLILGTYFPTQQKDVSRIIANLSSNDNIEYISIFGSSTSNRCRRDSDTDVYVKCTVKEPVEYYSGERVETPVDIFTNFDIPKDEPVYKSIMEGGILVYEK